MSSKKNKIKAIRFQRGDIIPLILVDDMDVHLEKDKRIHRKILELLSKFRNATEYSVSM